MKWILLSIVLFSVRWGAAQESRQVKASHPITGPWLFAGFKNDGEDGVYYALSRDGFHWHLIHNGQPVVLPTEKGELMRDPFLQRAPDGTVRMVWTWAHLSPTVLGYSASNDLVHWDRHRQLNVLANEPTAINAWAPALYWQPAKRRWLMFWSTTMSGRFPGPKTDTNGYENRIFSTYTTDFVHLSEPKVFFNPGYSVIDATLLAGRPHMLIFKDARGIPLEKNIRTVQGKSIEGPWREISKTFTETWTEGPASIEVNDGTLVYYDHYRAPQHYGAVFSPLTTPDGKLRWRDVTSQIDFPAGLRHGSFLKISEEEFRRLETLP